MNVDTTQDNSLPSDSQNQSSEGGQSQRHVSPSINVDEPVPITVRTFPDPADANQPPTVDLSNEIIKGTEHPGRDNEVNN